jgi:hypothetical protein
MVSSSKGPEREKKDEKDVVNSNKGKGRKKKRRTW